MGILFYLYEKINNLKKNTRQGNKRRKKKGSKSKQKTTSKNRECTMRSLKRRNHET